MRTDDRKTISIWDIQSYLSIELRLARDRALPLSQRLPVPAYRRLKTNAYRLAG
jgi:hypothetical protein